MQHAQLRAQVDEAILLEREVAALQKKHEGVFLGVGLASMQDAKALVAGWQLGFIHSARITSPDPGADADFNSVETLTMLLRHPSGRFIRDLTLGLPDHKVHMDYTDLVKVLTQWAPKTLNRLFTRPNGLPRPSRACLPFGPFENDDPSFRAPAGRVAAAPPFPLPGGNASPRAPSWRPGGARFQR